MTQQQQIRAAMRQLGMPRREFAARINVPIRTFNKWLLPDDSNDHREAPAIALHFIREIVKEYRKCV